MLYNTVKSINWCPLEKEHAFRRSSKMARALNPFKEILVKTLEHSSLHNCIVFRDHYRPTICLLGRGWRSLA
jgi:hypothetical protein